MQRSTKIVATLGPASSSSEVIKAMVAAGVDVVRMNFSHGTREEHLARAELVREAAHALGRTIGVMCDLQGPKIRIGKFESGKVALKKGDTFILDAECKMGNRERVGLDYRELTRDVHAGDVLLLDDGRLVLDVRKVSGSEIQTTVRVGGDLSNNKGINRQGGGLTAPALTAKDMQDIRTAVEMKADFLAVSFPKSGADMYMARELMRAAGGHAMIIAKMERAEAVQAMDELLKASDGIMVARGDLAVEVGDAAVPALQKKLIRTAREHNKLTITATQMMESMITSPVPTRAEVSDVANAVLDGTDAVMLSAETASGSYPVETVEAMARVCVEAEKSNEVTLDRHFLDRVFTRVDQSIAMAADPVRFHRTLDFAVQFRCADLCADPGNCDPLPVEPVSRRIPDDGRLSRPRARCHAAGSRGQSGQSRSRRKRRPDRGDLRRTDRYHWRHQYHENRKSGRSTSPLANFKLEVT